MASRWKRLVEETLKKMGFRSCNEQILLSKREFGNLFVSLNYLLSKPIQVDEHDFQVTIFHLDGLRKISLQSIMGGVTRGDKFRCQNQFH